MYVMWHDSVQIQWIVKLIFPQNLFWHLWSQRICVSFKIKINVRSLLVTSVANLNIPSNFWVISGRSQTMGLILGQKSVESRFGCSVWPKSWSLSKYFLGYDDIAWVWDIINPKLLWKFHQNPTCFDWIREDLKLV